MTGKKYYKTVLTALIFFALAAVLAGCGGAKDPGAESLRGGETRATLDPSLFAGMGMVQDAYAIAKEIPEVLDSLHCYCECKKHFGHKSLLTCYVDNHAMYCDVCMDEAFMAYELHRQGKDVKTIRRMVDERYAALTHSH